MMNAMIEQQVSKTIIGLLIYNKYRLIKEIKSLTLYALYSVEKN